MELFTVFKNVVTLWQSTNKQKGAKQMTTYTHIDISTIINIFHRSRAYKSIKAKYVYLSYDCITVLIAVYLLTKIRGQGVTKTAIFKFTQYYKYHLCYKYICRLVDYDLLNFSGRNYTLTDRGMNAVAEISNNVNNLLYSFCDKYNVEL
jgi:predicted transcriptional regulator